MRYSISIILIILLAFGCDRPNANFENEKEKITHAWTDWSKKASTGKPELIAYYFADDAIVLEPNSKPINGKAEMIKIYSAAPTNFEMDIKWENENEPNIIQFSKEGDMAYSLDKNEVPVPNSTGAIHMVRNNVLHLWKKDKEGNWKVSLLMVCPEKQLATSK